VPDDATKWNIREHMLYVKIEQSGGGAKRQPGGSREKAPDIWTRPVLYPKVDPYRIAGMNVPIISPKIM